MTPRERSHDGLGVRRYWWIRAQYAWRVLRFHGPRRVLGVRLLRREEAALRGAFAVTPLRPTNEYERGFEAGLRLALRQFNLRPFTEAEDRAMAEAARRALSGVRNREGGGSA